MIWFIADWHFNHTNILKYTERPYQRVKQMNNDIVKKHNSLVQPKDIVYVLGDVAMSKKVDALKYLHRMNGRKILILGNHDTPVTKTRWITEFGFEAVYSFFIADIEGHFVLMAHDPVESLFLARAVGFNRKPLITNGHIHNLGEHSVDKETGNVSINVGLDVNDMLPFSFSQLLERAREYGYEG